MRTVERPNTEPPQLTHLRQQGGENFGVLDSILDQVFGGVCVYCERQLLWRAPGDGLGTQDTDLPDDPGLLFTCDHFRPRRLLCSREPQVGQCMDDPPPHTPVCSIYDWNNLVYACQACNGVKGGQWPDDGDEADSYINPCAEPGSGDAPRSVFEYDLDNGEIKVRTGVTEVAKANAEQTIKDLSLNYNRNQESAIARNAGMRRVDLAILRHQWATVLEQSLDRLASIMPDLLPALVAGVVSPNARFSSICRQLIEQSEYRRYLA